MCVNQGLVLTQDAGKAPEEVRPRHGRLALPLLSYVARDIWAPGHSFLVCKRVLTGRPPWAAVQPGGAEAGHAAGAPTPAVTPTHK